MFSAPNPTPNNGNKFDELIEKQNKIYSDTYGVIQKMHKEERTPANIDEVHKESGYSRPTVEKSLARLTILKLLTEQKDKRTKSYSLNTDCLPSKKYYE